MNMITYEWELFQKNTKRYVDRSHKINIYCFEVSWYTDISNYANLSYWHILGTTSIRTSCSCCCSWSTSWVLAIEWVSWGTRGFIASATRKGLGLAACFFLKNHGKKQIIMPKLVFKQSLPWKECLKRPIHNAPGRENLATPWLPVAQMPKWKRYSRVKHSALFDKVCMMALKHRLVRFSGLTIIKTYPLL